MIKKSKSKGKCSAMNPACSTINLAKKGNSLQDRKTKLLVYEKELYHPINKPKPECQLPVGLTLTPKTAKKIRMCTAEDIRTTCPPPCCNCPRLKPALTAGQILKYGIKFGFKTAILLGVVYTTWDMGLWGTAEETECIWNSLKKVTFGPESQPGSPCVGKSVYKASERWNHTINKTFLFLTCFGKSIQSYINPVNKSCDSEEENLESEARDKKDPCSCK